MTRVTPKDRKIERTAESNHKWIDSCTDKQAHYHKTTGLNPLYSIPTVNNTWDTCTCCSMSRQSAESPHLRSKDSATGTYVLGNVRMTKRCAPRWCSRGDYSLKIITRRAVTSDKKLFPRSFPRVLEENSALSDVQQYPYIPNAALCICWRHVLRYSTTQ